MSTRSHAPARAGTPSLESALENIQLVWRLLQDDRVPTMLKAAIPLGIAVYFVAPVDAIPDRIPFLGKLDDLGVVLLGMTLFINLAPRAVVNEHRAALGLAPLAGKGLTGATRRRPEDLAVIDGTYRPVES